MSRGAQASWTTRCSSTAHLAAPRQLDATRSYKWGSAAWTINLLLVVQCPYLAPAKLLTIAGSKPGPAVLLNTLLGSTVMGAHAETLLSVPGAELHKVANNVQTLLVDGEFTVQLVGPGAAAAAAASAAPVDPQQLRVEAAVTSKQARVAFALGKHLPALKAAATIYSFALEQIQTEYYILVLPADTPAEVLEAVNDVLHDSCAFSTAKQVDAAYEEADNLNGRKEATALQAAEAAGTPPPPAAAAASGQAAAAPGISAGRYQLPNSGNATADKVAAGLVVGGTMVATAVGNAAAATATAISNYANKQVASQAPNAKPATVSPTFKKGLALAGSVASSAAYVTGRLAAMVGQASYATALAIARSLPGHKKQPNRSGGSGSEFASPEERSALHTVGAAGLVAFVDVYDSLEQAAKVVLAQSGDATSQYITYKYGDEAGKAAQSSVPIAQDMLSATFNFSRLGARAFISKTAKHSAKVYLKSTVAGIHPDEQAAAKLAKQQQKKQMQQQQQMQQTQMHGTYAGMQPAATGVPAASAAAYPPGCFTGEQVGRVGSSSHTPAGPYPAGSSAALAAAGGAAQGAAAPAGFNTAAAQQAAWRGGTAGSPSRR
ncbi:senescence-associated protein-domain-containing protein [Scenedesmus sp. NREL 46B-D3]|nr:senescence-associated protein-domain-containing protein [Scenedesmus sp. NREL 46B-D3]